MPIAAYLYHDPLLEPDPPVADWATAVAQVYRDVAQPDPTARPQWQQLVYACQQGAFDGVVVRRLEELGTSLGAIGARLQELEELGIPVIPVAVPAQHALTDPSTPKTELLQLLQQMQHYHRTQRQRQGHARNRIQALPPPGKAPYGYRRSAQRYLLDRTTAPVVKDFFEHFLLYGSVRGAARYLGQKYNKKISASTAHRWLTNPVYRGDLAYHTGDVVPDAHVAIVSREEAAQVDRLLRRNRRLPPRSASAPRSLAGLVVCGTCQRPCTVSQVARRGQAAAYLYLRVPQCPQRPRCASLPYEAVWEQTVTHICAELPPAVAAVALPDLAPVQQNLQGAIAAKQDILAQLPSLVTTGILDQTTADLRAYTLRTEIAALQRQQAQLPPANLAAIAQTVSLPQFWYDLSEAERRFYLREFLRQITLHRQGQDWDLELELIF